MGNLDSLRQYEREHLADLEDTAQRAEGILKEVYKPKTERIQKYVETLAERIELKDPMLDIQDKTQISSYIKKKYRECGVQESVVNSLNDYIPEGFKRAYVKEEEAVDNGDGTITEIRESKPPEKLDNSELLDRDEYLSEEEKKLKAKLALVRDEHELIYNESYNRKLQLPSQKVKQVSTPKPEAGQSLLWLSLGKGIEKLQAVRDTVYEFPPKREEDGDLAKAVDSFFAVFDGDGDTKWTKDVPEWFNVQITHEQHGKHAAAVKHGTILPDGSKRNLTREQVGDNAEDILKRAVELTESIPIIAALASWHKNNVEVRIAQRKADLSPKLSECA